MERSRSKTQHSLPRLIATTLAFSLVGLAACDSGTPEPDAPAGGEFGALPTNSAPIEVETETVEISRDGSIDPDRFPSDLPAGLTAEIPNNFPRTLPLYPGAQPAQGLGVTRDNGTDAGGLQLVSNDSAADVSKWYEGELIKNGWEVTESEMGNSTGSFSITKDSDSARVFVMDNPKGGSDLFFIFEGS